MPWKPLASCRDRSVPKLYNLRRAARAGLRIPPTVWSLASDLELGSCAPPPSIPGPWIVRSASPTEDSAESTAAGQFASCNAEDPAGFSEAARTVVASLPKDGEARPLGCVFVQPLLRPERGGILFFDGYHFECTTAPGGNQALTSGEERGEVRRGQLERGDHFSNWLKQIGKTFRAELRSAGNLDVEFTRDGDVYTLLQARPALFPVRRNPLLSLANHREILGDPPSPWIVSALELAGSEALGYFAEVDPAVADWGDAYAVSLGGRAWLNFSFFFRLMDHWGLPRTFVTEGVGGESGGPEDGRVLLGRFLFKSPRLVLLQLKNLWTILRSKKALAAFQREVDRATDLAALHAATAFGLGVALRTNFAINGALTGLTRVRRSLGIRGRARVTTEAMMEDYDALRSVPAVDRESGLDAWVAAFGHRGPLESDPARPRFIELRDVLLADLAHPSPHVPSPPGRGGRGPLYALDRRRESFRDDLMRIWLDLRRRILAAAESRKLAPEDAFLLSHADFAESPGDLESVNFAPRRMVQAGLAAIRVPDTAHAEAVAARLESAESAAQVPADADGFFRGVSLSPDGFEGPVHLADDLVALLQAEAVSPEPLLTPATVLVVPALEPSWAVLFPRVGAVITELGGELSHASILLREARKPAIVNCRGIYSALSDGDRVRLDGQAGTVARIGS